ncbi:MAG: class I SAM-dependent methyltransferase [Proteobacteria bacterium]|nr:class I SAM-dependent methyltransferase [Pseudomonadota bacterium]
MLLDVEKSRFQALDHWFDSIQGIEIASAFGKEIDAFKDFMHGDILLQLGSAGDSPWLDKLRYRYKWQLSPNRNDKNTVLSSCNQMALNRNSVDAIISPLSMSAFNHHKNPIDEIDRVLKPGGFAVFFGINPFSFWGLFLKMKKFSCFGEHKGNSMSFLFVKRAMQHRGYHCCHASHFYYLPPVLTKQGLEKLEVLNEIGKMVSLIPAGFYCLVFQKQELRPSLTAENLQEHYNRAHVLQPLCRTSSKS